MHWSSIYFVYLLLDLHHPVGNFAKFITRLLERHIFGCEGLVAVTNLEHYVPID